MSDAGYPKRDAGSRGFLDVLRHPVEAFATPFRGGAPPTDADRAAALSQEGVVVTCFLRASYEPLPRKWKQGHLILDMNGVRWSPGIARVRKKRATLLPHLRVVRTREAEGAEAMRLKAAFFSVIEATTELGEVSLAVPKDSVGLVLDRLRAQ